MSALKELLSFLFATAAFVILLVVRLAAPVVLPVILWMCEFIRLALKVVVSFFKALFRKPRLPRRRSDRLALALWAVILIVGGAFYGYTRYRELEEQKASREFEKLLRQPSGFEKRTSR